MTLNDLHYEIKFENRVKDKNNFFMKQNISFPFLNKNVFFLLGDAFFKIPKNLVIIDTKKHRYASVKASAFADCQDQF